MKVPKHEAIAICEESEESLDLIFKLEREGLLSDQIPSCSYEGTDLLRHEIEGECYHCDFQRLREKEKAEGRDWLDMTEAWDYYDYWHKKHEAKSY